MANVKLPIFHSGADIEASRLPCHAFKWQCAQCSTIGGPTPEGSYTGGTGYAVRRTDDALICYACCGLNDAEELRTMAPGARTTHYLSGGPGRWKGDDARPWEVSNWPGTLKIKPWRVHKGFHNIGRTRYDVWFTFAGREFYGVNIGDSQILHIRALKGARA